MLWLGAALGVAAAQQAGQKAAQPEQAAKKCDRPGCYCPMTADRRLYENDYLFNKAQTCWCKLARFNVYENSEKAQGEAMRGAYAAARQDNKIVLYIGNTGG
jgi:hypothetical protein